MIYTPPPTGDKVLFADWLEFRAIHSMSASIYELTNAWDDEFGQIDEIDTDILKEETPNLIIEEIQRRVYFLGESYPFTLTDNSLHLKKDIAEEHAAYLLCLHLSSIDTQLTDCEITDSERQLFQLISTIAAGGYFEADAIWFGFPRLDHSNFLDALKNTFHNRVKEGKVRETPLDGTNLSLKDGEIDIIVHKRMNDNFPGQLFFYGQVASGKYWDSKELSDNTIEYFFTFFEETPSKEYIRGIFIPFPPWHNLEKQQNTEALKTRIQAEVKKYGIIFSRYRIPYYINEVLVKFRKGMLTVQIDALDRISDLKTWSDQFIQILKRDHI